MLDKNGRIDVRYFKDKLNVYLNEHQHTGIQMGSMETNLLNTYGSDEQLKAWDELNARGATEDEQHEFLKNVVGGLGTPYKEPFKSKKRLEEVSGITSSHETTNPYKEFKKTDMYKHLLSQTNIEDVIRSAFIAGHSLGLKKE
jgi:hypothetical protein